MKEIKKILHGMNKQQLQKIYKMLHCKNIQSSKQNIIKKILKPFCKTGLSEYQKPLFKYSTRKNECRTFISKPDVDISKIIFEEILSYNEKELKYVEEIGSGGGGTVFLLSDDDDNYQFALKEIQKTKDKEDRLIIDDEILIIKELEKKKIPCNIVPARIIDENDDYWSVIMPKYSGSLEYFIGRLNPFEIINLGIELGEIYTCLLHNGLYYTDSKPSQVLYKCTTDDTFSVTLGDLGSIFHKNEDYLQTYPFPPKNGYKSFNDIEYIHEKVVVWGFVLMLLMMINDDTDLLISDLLSWKNMVITESKNTFKTFQQHITSLLREHPMKDFFETFLGIKKNLYEMVENGEYTMKHVIEYLRGYPFLIRTTKDVFPNNNLEQLQNLSLECWNHKNINLDGKIYTIYVNSEIASYGVLDKDNTLWSLCTSSKSRGKGYAKKIIDEMFRDVCKKGGENFYLFVDENSPKKWYEKLGFNYIPLSPLEKTKYPDKNIQKMFKKCI